MCAQKQKLDDVEDFHSASLLYPLHQLSIDGGRGVGNKCQFTKPSRFASRGKKFRHILFTYYIYNYFFLIYSVCTYL